MKAFGVSVKLFLFILIFTGTGILLYLLFPAFHPSLPTLPSVFSTSLAVEGTVIVLDAGHGGEDGGAVGADGTLEKDLNLTLTKDVAQILQYSGFHVILTRESDVMLGDGSTGKKKQADLSERLQIAGSGEEHVLVSIHMNKFPDARCKGLQVYYSPNHERSAVLAQAVQSAVQSSLQPDNNRKTKAATSAIYLLHRAQIPAILIECGFLSNPEELAKLKDEAYQKELATVIAAAVMNGVMNERT